MPERTSSANADGIHEPFSVADVPWEEFAKGDRFASRFRQHGGTSARQAVEPPSLPHAGRGARPHTGRHSDAAYWRALVPTVRRQLLLLPVLPEGETSAAEPQQ